MKEPNIQKQIDDAQDQYRDGLITKDEYDQARYRIIHNYKEWIRRNK